MRKSIRNQKEDRRRLCNIIPQGVKAIEGTMAGKSLFTYDKNSKPAIAYNNFCKEVLKIEKQRARNEIAHDR